MITQAAAVEGVKGVERESVGRRHVNSPIDGLQPVYITEGSRVSTV